MDKCTLGNSKAVMNLMTTLERPEFMEHNRIIARVLDKFYKDTKAIMCIQDNKVRNAVLVVWRHSFIDRVNQLEIPEVLKTYTINAGVTRYRQCIKRDVIAEKGISVATATFLVESNPNLMASLQKGKKHSGTGGKTC